MHGQKIVVIEGCKDYLACFRAEINLKELIQDRNRFIQQNCATLAQYMTSLYQKC